MQKKVLEILKRTMSILVAIAMVSIMLPLGWGANTVLASEQTTTLTPTKDKFVDNSGGYDYWSSGEGKTLYVGQYTEYGNAQSALCFDVSSIPGEVTSAKLKLYVKYTNASPKLTIYGSNQDDWAETGTVVPTKDVTVLTNASVGTSWREFDVTSFIQDEFDGDQIASLVLHIGDNSYDNDFYFTSSEDPNKPQLVVTYINPTATMTSAALNESNINGATVDIALDGTAFVDSSLNKLNFSISGAPFTVSNVNYTDDTHCTLTIAHDGADFDVNKNFAVVIDNAELDTSVNVTTNQLTVTATNDAESISISNNGITEGSENGEVINVALTGGQFADTITPANWTVSNLPSGVTKGTVTRVNDASVNIVLSGNATEDYDSDITNVSVSCTTAEYTDSTGGGSLSDTGITLTAVNDAESIAISDDGLITEGAEDGEIITATLTGGRFDDTITPANWTVSNLPSGVTKGTVTRVNDTSVNIVLSGDAAEDYDSDITNVAVSCTTSEYTDSMGGGSLSDTGIILTAVNDAESMSISDDGLITEGAEDGEIITATLTGGQFADTITPANWTVSNLPSGVAKGTVTRVNDTTVTIALSGDATEDYDSDIANVAVSCTTAEYTDSTGGGSLSDTGITLTAVNDAESMSISDDGLITEGAEDGEIITATLTGGQFADTITPANWTVSNLPSGVTKGAVTRVNDTTVTIALSGDAAEDYDSDIMNVAVSCTTSEYTDSTGGGSLSDTGITLTAVNEAESIAISDDGLITEGTEDGEIITATLTGAQFADTITPANWTVSNLPSGVTKGTVTRVNDTTVTIALSGDAAEDYDSDITDVKVTCTTSEYIDSTDGGSLSNTGITLTAVNDVESIAIGDDGLITEGAEDGEVITATLTGGQFADTITPANWTVSNLPTGVTKGTVTRVNDTTVTIKLSGNADKDYDSDITNVAVSCTTSEYTDNTGGGSLSDTGITLTAVNDAESIAISDDGLITEGAEDGEVITVSLAGGQFADTITPANWTVSNLPSGVAKGAVTRVNDTTVTIKLSGNANKDYDSNITNVKVTCDSTEYTDNTGGGSLSDTGITLTAVNDAESIAISDDGLITEGAEDGEVITATLTGGQFADTITPANWPVSNLPSGVAKGAVTRVNDTTVTIKLSGNANKDYDSDITNVKVTCDSTEYKDSTGGGNLSDTGITLTAVNDVESIAISDDGLITEGAEDGEVIIVSLTGGQFADTITPANWTVSNLPSGVAKGAVTRVNDTTVTIKLSGNANKDYDSDITNVKVTCDSNQYDSGISSLSASHGVVLKAIVEPTPTPPSVSEKQIVGVSGVLTDKFGNPLVGYLVEIHSDPMVAVTDENGKFTFYGVEIGDHSLIVKNSSGTTMKTFSLSIEEGDAFDWEAESSEVNVTVVSNIVMLSFDIIVGSDDGDVAINKITCQDNPQTGEDFDKRFVLVLVVLTAVVVSGLILCWRKRTE